MVWHAIYYTRQTTPFLDSRMWRSDTLSLSELWYAFVYSLSVCVSRVELIGYPQPCLLNLSSFKGPTPKAQTLMQGVSKLDNSLLRWTDIYDQ